MKELIKSVIEKENFRPSGLGILINPFYLARSDLHRQIRALSARIKGRVLDVGCGVKPYRSLFAVENYVGLEFDTPENRRSKRADDFYDGGKFPYPDQAFDSVLCFEVLEHVPRPDEFVGELRRVLKPGGNLLLTVPFLFEEHEAPYDFHRFTRYGLKALLERNGFEIVVHDQIVRGLPCLSQMLASTFVKATFRFQGAAVRMGLQALSAPVVNLVGFFLKIWPVNHELYMGHVTFSLRR